MSMFFRSHSHFANSEWKVGAGGTAIDESRHGAMHRCEAIYFPSEAIQFKMAPTASGSFPLNP